MSKKWIVIGVTTALFIVFLAWLFIESSKPLPGQKFPDEGRDHVEVGKEVYYKTNPPTSGKHYADWVRAGVYTEPKDDRNLVHSLEHGYIIMHYKCSDKSGSPEATESAELSQVCKERRDQLAKVYEEKGGRKLIVVPGPNLETDFAISAWTYLDKFSDFDSSRIEKFIDAHRDMGPEKTME